jgi:ComF family protein
MLNWILPPRCPMTGRLVSRNGALDPEYWAQLTFIQSPLCACCGNPFAAGVTGDMSCGACLREPPDFTSARAALKYDDASAKMILRLKYADGTILAPLFANWLQQAGAKLIEDSDLIVPVPLHRWRLLKRRYNQAGLLAQKLSQLANLPHEPFALQRTKATPPQGHKSKAARLDNMQGAFAALPNKVNGKHILLIDDVLTSGATVNACARALYKGGAVKVHVLTIARVAHTD